MITIIRRASSSSHVDCVARLSPGRVVVRVRPAPRPSSWSSPSVESSVHSPSFFGREGGRIINGNDTEHAQGGQEGEPPLEDLHRVRSAVHVAQKVGEVVGRDHDVQQELQSEEEGRWVLRGGGEGQMR